MGQAKASGIILTNRDASTVLGMVARDNREHDIAAWFGVNQGRIAEIKGGSHGSIAVAKAPRWRSGDIWSPCLTQRSRFPEDRRKGRACTIQGRKKIGQQLLPTQNWTLVELRLTGLKLYLFKIFNPDLCILHDEVVPSGSPVQ